MTGWGFLFMLVGVTFLTAQLSRVINYIEPPARPSHPRAVPR